MTMGQITKMAYIGTFSSRRDVLMCESECAASFMNIDHTCFFLRDIFWRDLMSKCGSCFKNNLDLNVAFFNMNLGPIHFFGTLNSDSMVEITELLRSQEAGIMWFFFFWDISLQSWLLCSSSSLQFQLWSIQHPPGSPVHFKVRKQNDGRFNQEYSLWRLEFVLKHRCMGTLLTSNKS